MLMMLAVFGHMGQKPAQLMLMMLAPFGLMASSSAMWAKTSPADAHDVGRLWPHGPKAAQLMLMMLAPFSLMASSFGDVGQNQPS